MAQERVAVLTRHLVSAPVASELPEFDPGEVYLFLTRDNVELRARMLDHLKVRQRDVYDLVRVSAARCKPSTCSHGRYTVLCVAGGPRVPQRDRNIVFIGKQAHLGVEHSCACAQDELYKPDYHLSMYEFRDLTLRRLQLFVAQRFFSVFDYLKGARPCR